MIAGLGFRVAAVPFHSWTPDVYQGSPTPVTGFMASAAKAAAFGALLRSLVVLPPEDVDAWLACRDPELARSFLRHYPAERMKAWAAPAAPKAK